jgi:hypothetical protein
MGLGFQPSRISFFEPHGAIELRSAFGFSWRHPLVCTNPLSIRLAIESLLFNAILTVFVVPAQLAGAAFLQAFRVCAHGRTSMRANTVITASDIGQPNRIKNCFTAQPPSATQCD